MHPADLRVNYTLGQLLEHESPEHPMHLFARWFEEAYAQGGFEANAMTLCTVRADGQPTGRVVLMKDFSEDGIVFYTNYESDKSIELEDVGKAGLVFWWAPNQRQVRLDGYVERVSEEEADVYFASRPRESQIGAWVSPQSRPILGRDELEVREAEVEARYAERPIPRPPHWGGWRVVPTRIEFWQGRPGRLHDRLLYVLNEDGDWSMGRLAP